MKSTLIALLLVCLFSTSSLANSKTPLLFGRSENISTTSVSVNLSRLNPQEVAKEIDLFINQYFTWTKNFSDLYLEMVYTILALSALLFLLRRKREKNYDELSNPYYTINWILFLCLSIVEIFYVMTIGKRALWFCKPDEVGWVWTVINFIIFSFVVFNQIKCFLNTLEDIKDNSYAHFSWNWGLYSWPIAIIATLVMGYFYPSGIIIIGPLFLLFQLIQIAIIFKNIIPDGGWGNALLGTIVYLLGSVATVALLANFLELLVIVLVGALVLSIFASGSSSSTSSPSQPITRKQCPYCGVTGNIDGSWNCVCDYRRRHPEY